MDESVKKVLEKWYNSVIAKPVIFHYNPNKKHCKEAYVSEWIRGLFFVSENGAGMGDIMKQLQTIPREDGFYMPGEFEPHRGTYMIWPQRTDVWRQGGRPAQKVFARIAETIGEYEPVTMLVNGDQYENAREMLADNIRVLEVSNNDSWCRDTGATFVKNKEGVIRGIDWSFNAWGGLVDGLYFPWDKDDKVAAKLCELEQADRYRLSDFVLEGGSIHVDGEGTALVTEECLLSAGRNPERKKEQIEAVLMNYLNVDKIIWLKNGMYLDETNGHVDNICAFVRPGVVVLAWTDDREDPQYAISRECYETLCQETDARGRTLEVHKLMLPKPMYITEEEADGIDRIAGTKARMAGDRMADSYVNYYVCNGAVIMPAFSDPMDQPARELLSALYPKHQVIQINTREILLGGGNIHCITQQIPQ